MNNENFLGLNGFIWFIGVVEDRQDPSKTGRLRVRALGHHTENKTLLFDMSNESTYSKDIAINNLKIDEIDKKIEYTINNFYDPDFIKTKAKLEKEKRKLDLLNLFNIKLNL